MSSGSESRASDEGRGTPLCVKGFVLDLTPPPGPFLFSVFGGPERRDPDLDPPQTTGSLDCDKPRCAIDDPRTDLHRPSDFLTDLEHPIYEVTLLNV